MPIPWSSNTVVAQLPELRQFLVPCVNCHLTVCLPIHVWGTILSGVGAARQLQRLRVHMLGKPVSILCGLYTLLHGVSDVTRH